MMKTLSALLAFGLMGAIPAAAQSYPSKTITIVVPASPGGVTDTLARQLAQRFNEKWGQQAVVENRPGANNSIAAEYVSKSAPDGHTLFIGPDGTFVANPSLYPKLPYDPDKSFTPITGLVVINHALIANPAVQAGSVKDLLAMAKEKPGTINYGTFGIGSSGHMNMELLQNMSGARFQAVHYKGATPALTDTIAGHIQMMFVSVGTAVPQWRADKVKFIAVSSAKRMPQLPDVPTVSESGVPGYEAVSWFGLFGPAGIPADVTAKINGEIRAMHAEAEFRKTFLDKFYFQSIAGPPEQLAKFIKDEEPKWRKIITDAKIKVE
ncbi:MAG TPA: tripartite tricarboxylate transporter substrate binding protein [Xanthobacteraceae bacterium]|jgi:tripartite-type tricarboxylate transporter receptor subunit TctC|nr:tripartite tricarboxylate transporter substrate binding protein [Xanthobacteraceae bacterium]